MRLLAKKLLFLMLSFSLVSCATMQGAGKAISNLTGSHPWENLKTKYIEDDEIQEYKSMEDALTTGDFSKDESEKDKEHIRNKNKVYAPEVIAYLDSIIDKLLESWDGTPVEYEIHITEENTFGAFTNSEGKIFVKTGLLKEATDSHQVAYILAHELSHLLLRHHSRMEKVNQQKEQVQFVAGAVMAVNVVKDVSIVELADGSKSLDYSPSEQSQENITKAAMYSYLINGITDHVVSTAWGRTEEYEADLLGTDLLIKAGYTPKGMDQALQSIADFEAALAKSNAEMEKRAEDLNTRRGKEVDSALQKMPTSELSQQLPNAVKAGLDKALTSVFDYFTNTHEDALTRREEAIKYVDKFYGSVLGTNYVSSEERKALWVQDKEKMKLDRILESNQSMMAAKQAMEQGDFEKALELARKSQIGKLANQPAQRELMYNIRLAQNEVEKANQNLMLVQNWENASESLYQAMIDYQLSQKNYKSALNYIAMSEQALGTKRVFALQKFTALNELGEEEAATAALNACLTDSYQKEICVTLHNELHGESKEAEVKPENRGLKGMFDALGIGG